MNRRHLMRSFAAGLLALTALPVAAQEVTLRLHQFLPPMSTNPAQVLKPWAARVTEASDGRIVIEHFDAMALGGKPADLLDQARDGVVDLSMSLTGYTPGRYPRSEVFELPFMMTDPVATSLAFWDMIEADFQGNEFADMVILGAWVHGPGMIHTADPVNTLEDMAGKTLRGPTRIVNELLTEMGATAVGMPLPAVPESLSKGVINGTVIPWEVTPSIRLAELLDNHTEFSGDEAFYTATFVLAMNRDRFEALPADLQAVLMEQSGAALAAEAARIMFAADVPGRAIAEAAGNTIVTLDEAEVARWKAAAAPVVTRWIAEMDAQGIDGQALIDQARALIVQHSAM